MMPRVKLMHPKCKKLGIREVMDMTHVPSLKSFRRIVVKVGSSLLVDPAKGLKTEWLSALGEDLAALGLRCLPFDFYPTESAMRQVSIRRSFRWSPCRALRW